METARTSNCRIHKGLPRQTRDHPVHGCGRGKRRSTCCARTPKLFPDGGAPGAQRRRGRSQLRPEPVTAAPSQEMLTAAGLAKKKEHLRINFELRTRSSPVLRINCWVRRRGQATHGAVEFPADFVTPQLANLKGVVRWKSPKVKEKVLPGAGRRRWRSTYGAESVDVLRAGTSPAWKTSFELQEGTQHPQPARRGIAQTRFRSSCRSRRSNRKPAMWSMTSC